MRASGPERHRSRVRACSLSSRAKEDIDVDGAALFGAQQAEAYDAKLRRTFGLLAVNPGLARERAEIAPPVLVHPCGSPIVLYIIEPDGPHSAQVFEGSEAGAPPVIP